MPYVAKGKCVYKRDTGKKVGCTKGSVKKYLGALYANVHEAKYKRIQPKNGDYLYCIKDVVKTSGKFKGQKSFVEGHYYKIHFSMGDINIVENESGNDVNIYTDNISDYFALIPEEDYDKSVNFNPFKNLNESDDLEWVQDALKVNPLEFNGKELFIDIKDLNREEREELVKMIIPYIEVDGINRGEDNIDWSNDCFSGKQYLQSKHVAISLHCGIEDNGFMPLKGAICCLSYTYENETNDKTHIIPLNGRMLLNYNKLNESEGDDLEWAQDTVNTTPTYRFGDLVFRPHHIPGAVYSRLNFSNGHYISVVGGPHLYGDGVNTFEIWASSEDSPEGYLSKSEVTDRMFDLQQLPPIEGKGSFKAAPTTESKESKPLLTEGRYDAITRKVVNDIITAVKNTTGQNNELHQFILPNDFNSEEYEYIQDGMAFSLELNIHHQSVFTTKAVEKESEAYYVNTTNDSEDNVIMMTVVVDPNWEPQIYEKLFYKLQEDVRHEIEHFTQSGYYRIEDRPTSTTQTINLKTTYGHHKHKIEVPALVHGFYRRAKLEKRPLDEVMMEDLDSEIEKGNLTKKQAENLLKMWVEYAQQNLPTAIYRTK